MSDELLTGETKPKVMKKTTEATKDQEIDTVFFYKEYEVANGKLVLKIDINEYYEDAEIYLTALCSYRNIPMNVSEVSYDDPLVMYIYENTTQPKGNSERMEAAVAMAKKHYAIMLQKTNVEAGMLAAAAESEFNEYEVKPFPPSKEKKLPGIVILPEIKRDITIDAERQMKMIYDAIMQSPEIQSELERSIAVASQEYVKNIKKAGFRTS